MQLPSDMANFMQTVESPINIGEMLNLLDSSKNPCVFIKYIKNKDSAHYYANDNYIRLLGLNNLNQLLRTSDYDLTKTRKDAEKYHEYDRYVIEEGKTLHVHEVITPNYNQTVVKTLQGNLYPLYAESDRANCILGVTFPDSNLFKLDFDTLFNLTSTDLDGLLMRRRYPIQLDYSSITLSKMEIRTLVQLLKGEHAGEIAKELQIKQTTVESYLVNIKNKLAVNSKSELIKFVLEKKLLEQIII